MADEEDPWGFDEGGDDEAPSAQDAPTTEPVASSESVENKTDSKEIVKVEEEEQAPAPPPPEDDGYRKPVQLYKHWVRPKFLQYKYMYNYRTNYYNDVIDYLDKRQIGVDRDIPRAQTWAERVLRTNSCSGRSPSRYLQSDKKDKHLIQTLAASIRTYNYHTKAYINQKYSHVL